MFVFSRRLRVCFTWLCLGVLAWCAHFAMSGDFLFYEDDYAVVVDAMARNRPQMIANFFDHLQCWPQGSPLAFGLKAPLSWLGVNLRGLQGVYWIGWGVLFVNALLLVRLAGRIMDPKAAAAAGAVFILFPAITVQQWATYFMGYGAALFFLLAALNLYISGLKVWSYLVIALALITVQSAFFPFLAAPLLSTPWRRAHLGRLFKHVGALGGILALYCLVLIILAEPRLVQRSQDMGAGPICFKAMTGMFIGPWTVFQAIFTRPFHGMLQPHLHAGWALLGAAAATGVLAASLPGRPAGRLRPVVRWQVFAAALAMLMLAYPLSFFPPHWPPRALAGTMTRAHSMAALGGALAFGVLASWVFSIASSKRAKTWLVGGFFIYFIGLQFFFLRVQEDYAASGQRQRVFWQQALALCPDLENGVKVFLEPSAWDHPGLVSTHSWAVREILKRLVSFPDSWSEPPKAFLMRDSVKDHVFEQDGALLWREGIYGDEHRLHPLEPSRVVVLTAGPDGALTRRFGEYLLGPDRNLRLPLKSLGEPTVSQFGRGPAYSYLIGEQLNGPVEESRAASSQP